MMTRTWRWRGFCTVPVCVVLAATCGLAQAQISGGGGFGGTGGASGFGGGAAGGAGGAAGAGGGAQGGGAQGGAAGSAGGILVDAQGVVRAVLVKDKTGQLDRKRREELAAKSLSPDVNAHSSLRKVSLTRLEAACEKYAKDRTVVPSEMQNLAGLQRIDYVFVDPDNHDIVIAGPAEGYVTDATGRAIGNSTGRPPLRLDDLMVALRALHGGGGMIECSIDPTEQGLASLKSYVSKGSGSMTSAQARAKFDRLDEVLGMQNVRVSGVPAETHFAQLLVEADVRMKRLATGHDAAPVKGFRSHLSMAGAAGESMQRWWFTPMYDAFKKSDDGLAFEFSGQRAQLLSEDEVFSDSGKRSKAAAKRASTDRYARQFTEKFPQIADALPVFAELQSLFDLAVLAALFQKERLPEKVGWTMALFLDTERATVAKHHVPRQIHSISNFKMVGKSVYVAHVTGGVTINAWQVLRDGEYSHDSEGQLDQKRDEAVAARRSTDHPWWWD